jgi:hypothetical protein
VLGADFRIVRHELSYGTPERGGTFWLVHARPTRSGDFQLQYRYGYVDHARPTAPLYTHVQHESYVRVGERGCWRRREGVDVCLGDTIILPFVVNDLRGHSFSLTFRGRRSTPPPAGPEPLPPDLSPAVASVANPADPQLRYLGSSTHVMLSRVLGGTAVYSAMFEARTPGRFNLGLSVRDSALPAARESALGSVPVIVVPRGQPVTVLLQNESVTSVDSIRPFSSHTGNQYLTTALLLQPGDRISLEYAHVTTRGRDPRVEPGKVAPSITRHPFALDPRERFNAWIAPYLPR